MIITVDDRCVKLGARPCAIEISTPPRHLSAEALKRAAGLADMRASVSWTATRIGKVPVQPAALLRVLLLPFARELLLPGLSPRRAQFVSVNPL